MSYLDKVNRCNACDLSKYTPFVVGDIQVGWLTGARAQVVLQYPEVFVESAAGIAMAPGLSTAEDRTNALAGVAPQLVSSGLFRPGTGEMYGVKNQWREPALLHMDRMLVPAFGARAYGVHLNGWLVKDGAPYLWIGTRAADRIVEPGKLDNMVAGGQPAALSLTENLIKEAGEEAGLSADLARTARAVSVISYCFETANGLRNDTLFCYDLDVPDDVMPRNTDGEISGFELMALPEILALVRDTERFKFNVNLVIIDFALRHGALTAENTPDYEKIAAGLRRWPQPMV